MLISPPFLPANSGAAVYDAQCVKDAMPGGLVGSGAYPVSQAMGWHGGIHVGSPASGEPVRAIADGWVVYRRENTETAYDGQTYSTGCVVIRHETEIGARLNAAGPATPTKFTYYSITLHLSTLDKDLPAVTKPIWRKDRLGTPGKINSQDNRIHFEIVCGDDDLKALVNRKTGRLVLESDGRSDAVYGTTYIFVPQGAPLHAKMPAAGSAGASTDLTTEDLVIGIDHEAGDVSLTTWRLAGAVAGSITEPNKAEYRLYEEAVARHKAMPANSSPSGWYELLRFGRNLGPDPLPAQAPHWRQIKLSDGSQKWIDLNTRATTKYSDADFPHWRGWRLVDDDVTDADSRCDSKMIERLLNTTPEGEPIANDTPQSRANRLCAGDVQSKLAKTICKFPTEWVKGDVELRWKWVKEQGNPYTRQPLSEQDFAGFAEFAKKLCFWEELPEADKTRLTKKHWHFHPREFIAHMRKCGWLSNDEMTQCIPRNSPAGLVSRSTAYGRVLTLGQSINLMSRKFGLCSPIRLIHVLAQIWAETGYLRLTREVGAQHARYAPYIGRGLIQITWRDKYESYNEFAQLTPNGGGNFNLELIAVNSYHCGNSSGFYWVSKRYLESIGISNTNLSKIADEGLNASSIGKLCLWINGGGNHYDHRHIHVFYIRRILDDVVYSSAQNIENVSFNRVEFERKNIVVNGFSVNKIVGVKQSTAVMNIRIDHAHQR